MQGTTLAVAIVVSILVLVLRPPHALAAYIAVVIWYPYYLAISIGSIDVSASRIVVTVLLLRCLCDARISRRFVWCQLDTWVALSMVVYVGMYCITHPLESALENRGGFLIDTWFAYIIVRLIVTDKATLISFIRVTSIVLVPLAILGLIESIFNWRPFFQLMRFRPWRTPIGEIVGRYRWGLFRARGPFGHPIMFGACFVMFLPLIWDLRHQRGYWGQLAYPLCGIAVIGALSSMSSGPWIMLIAMIFCLVMGKYKHWVKPLFIAFVLSCILAEVASNTPLHHILFSRANVVGGDAIHRARVIDLAIEHFDEWWLMGYGNKDPGWGSQGLYAPYTDVTNQFIRAGVDYGILGMIALCAVLVTGFRGLSRASQKTRDIELKSLYWSLGSVLFCLIVFWMGVSIHGQALPLTYSIFGITGSSITFAKHAEANRGDLLPTNNSNLVLAHGQIK